MWVIFDCVQHFDFTLDNWLQHSRHLLRFIMIIISFEIKHVPLELLLYVSLRFLIFAFTIFCKLIAFIIPTSGRVVILPVSQTQPAEFFVAHFALHVIAALILLYRSAALFVRACFAICYDPIYIFTFARIFNFPHFKHLTIHRPMLFLATPKAIRIATKTRDHCAI